MELFQKEVLPEIAEYTPRFELLIMGYKCIGDEVLTADGFKQSEIFHDEWFCRNNNKFFLKTQSEFDKLYYSNELFCTEKNGSRVTKNSQAHRKVARELVMNFEN